MPSDDPGRDEPARILSMAREFPLLGIDATRAAQIAAECAALRAACDQAARRFPASEAAQFAQRFAPTDGHAGR